VGLAGERSLLFVWLDVSSEWEENLVRSDALFFFSGSCGGVGLVCEKRGIRVVKSKR